MLAAKETMPEPTSAPVAVIPSDTGLTPEEGMAFAFLEVVSKLWFSTSGPSFASMSLVCFRK